MVFSDDRSQLLGGAHTTDYQSVYHYNGGRSATSEVFDPNGSMSPARRTFCLFTTFDLILTFILWVIYTQIVGSNGDRWASLKEQVLDYTFERSLFDTVMIAVVRFTFIILAYALFKLSHWWVIAICTTMTCIYLLFKCFLFKFDDKLLGGSNPLSYILLIVCFVLSWIETWLLDFKVLPWENRFKAAVLHVTQIEPRTSYANTISRHSSAEDVGQYFTPAGSEDESEQAPPSPHHHVNNHHHNLGWASKQHSRKETENYTQLLADAKEEFLNIFNIDDWKLESGTSLEDGMIYSHYGKKYGKKLFKLQGKIKMAPKELCEDMVNTLNDSVKWNPTILESRTLQVLDSNTHIVYNISAEAAGGLVSSRDFINIRQVTKVGDMYISYGIGCTHPDMPVQKKYIRGDNGPGGWIFQTVPGDPDASLFTWIINTNLRGWLPQAAIDQAMSGVLSSYFTILKQHYKKVLLERQT